MVSIYLYYLHLCYNCIKHKQVLIKFLVVLHQHQMTVEFFWFWITMMENSLNLI